VEYDLHHSIKQAVALDFQTISTDTTTAGNIIDTAGFESLEFIVGTGTVTDGDYAFKIEDGDDDGLSDNDDVDSTLILGVLTGFTADADDDKALRVGVLSKKRYVRLSIVSTNTSSGAEIFAVAVLGHAKSQPTAE